MVIARLTFGSPGPSENKLQLKYQSKNVPIIRRCFVLYIPRYVLSTTMVDNGTEYLGTCRSSLHIGCRWPRLDAVSQPDLPSCQG